jgi:hypothetical protein
VPEEDYHPQYVDAVRRVIDAVDAAAAALAAAAADSDDEGGGAGEDGAEGGGAPGRGVSLAGHQPLPQEAVQRLSQLLDWTTEVAGPLTASQAALVAALVAGGVAEAAAAGHDSASGANGRSPRRVLTSDQVFLLRQLLGLL